jgi:hypothetical protein
MSLALERHESCFGEDTWASDFRPEDRSTLLWERIIATASNTDQIREHMEVVCSQGGKIGSVDHVQGEEIKLTKNDSPDGKHHFIPMSMVKSVDDKVHLSMPGSEVKQTGRSE